MRNDLPPGFEIHWYKITSVLGKGGYGVTYLAEDTNLKKQVAIKEYFPKDYAAREDGYTVHPVTGEYSGMFKWGLDRFLREARTLAQFHHPNIVRVLSVFELNNTAYMVMEYEQGEDLSKVYKKGKLSQQQLLDIYLPVIDGLKRVHEAGFIHRDVKPSNIYIRRDGSPVLLDFGSARQSTGKTTVALTSLVTYGFAPYEQYADSDDKQGPWTDIYALGACLYLAVTGKLPKEAMARGTEIISHNVDPLEKCSDIGGPEYSQSFLQAIDKALSFQIPDRPQDLEEWKMLLTEQGGTLSGDTIKINEIFSDDIFQAPTEVSEPEKETLLTSFNFSVLKEKWPWLGAAAAVVLVVALIFLLIPGEPEKTEAELLIEQAELAYKAGKLIEPQGSSALDLYKKAQRLRPDDVEVQKARQVIVKDYLQQIQEDRAAGRPERALQGISLLYIAEPDDPQVLAVKQQLDAWQYQQEQIRQLMQQANHDLQQGNFTGEGEDNAYERFRQVLSLQPDNKEAQAGVEKIIDHYHGLAKTQIQKGKIKRAKKFLDIMLSIAPQARQTVELEKSLQDRQLAKTDNLTQLLDKANKAFNRGRLTKPSRANAVYYYQKVLSLEPGNRKAKRGMNRVRQKMIREFNQAKERRNFRYARDLIASFSRVFPNSKLTKNMRTELDKIVNQPDFEAISGVLAKYKRVFESKNSKLLNSMSEVQPSRQAFVKSLFAQYKSFRIKITDLQHINKQRKAVAKIQIEQLVNIDGSHVTPGNWSKFDIEIKRNSYGEWRVKWLNQ